MKPATPPGLNDPLAHQMPQMETATILEVSSPAFHDSDSIPARYSAYEKSVSIPLRWTAGPSETRSYVIFMEDPDAPVTPLPVVHWLAWNIPADTLSLPEGVVDKDELSNPDGMRQGINVRKKIGYLGPRPPEGNPPHHYNIQVFALDRVLALPPRASRQQLLTACEGHVIAAGVLVGKFAWPVESGGR